METGSVSITLTGKNMKDIGDLARQLAEECTGPVTPPTSRRGRKPVEPEESLDETETELDPQEENLNGEDEGAESLDDLPDDEAEETLEEPAPPAKVAKVTEKGINKAAFNHAKKFGKAKTMEILKRKFKVQSILELDKKHYSAAILALKL